MIYVIFILSAGYLLTIFFRKIQYYSVPNEPFIFIFEIADTKKGQILNKQPINDSLSTYDCQNHFISDLVLRGLFLEIMPLPLTIKTPYLLGTEEYDT